MNAITISALSTHIVALFERDELMRDVWVVGEVSNWRRATSGHVYFSLKDAGATIGAVMWRGQAATHTWLPRDGDQVIAHGYVGVYVDRGQYQLYVNQLQPAGRGQLYAAFEALKERLMLEGLFAAERKRSIPVMPRRVAVVTSAEAAALRDILRVLSNRWPMLDVVVFPTLVQGSEASLQICAAIANANRYSATVEPIDCILLARGGGSIEDLWSFNDEQVARAIASSQCPVVTGVGHETDFTIADFVADLRAPTPSAAAAACSPDCAEVRAQLDSVVQRLWQDAAELVQAERAHFEQRALRLQRVHPERQMARHRQQLDEGIRRLQYTAEQMLHHHSNRTESAALRLAALNPAGVLRRGYSIVQGEAGQIVAAPDQAHAGERLAVRTAGGLYEAEKVS